MTAKQTAHAPTFVLLRQACEAAKIIRVREDGAGLGRPAAGVASGTGRWRP
jgi:hypothetical protein